MKRLTFAVVAPAVLGLGLVGLSPSSTARAEEIFCPTTTISWSLSAPPEKNSTLTVSVTATDTTYGISSIRLLAYADNDLQEDGYTPAYDTLITDQTHNIVGCPTTVNDSFTVTIGNIDNGYTFQLDVTNCNNCLSRREKISCRMILNNLTDFDNGNPTKVTGWLTPAPKWVTHQGRECVQIKVTAGCHFTFKGAYWSDGTRVDFTSVKDANGGTQGFNGLWCRGD